MDRRRVLDGLGTAASRKVLWLIAGLSLVRLLLGGMLGLTYDETYVAAMSLNLSWGYVDHPPGAMVLSAISQIVTGSTDNLALRLPAIALFAGTTWLVYRIGAVLFSERAGWYAALLLSLLPLFSLYLGMHGLTDAPMLFCLAATTLCLAHALFDEHSRWIHWIAAGVFAGLAVDSKYTAGVALLGFAVFVLSSPQRWKLLARPEPYAAVATALLIFAPILAWNAQHDWISFKFQGSRIGSGGIAPQALLKYVAVQSLFLMPGPWLLLTVAALKAIRLGPGSGRTWFLVCAGALPIFFFTGLRLFPSFDKGYHWVAPGYLLLCPLAGWLLEDIFRRWPRLMKTLTHVSVATVGIILSIVVIDTRTKWLWYAVPSLAHHDPLLKDSVDWTDLPSAIAQLEPAGPEQALGIGLDWEECVKADWALRGKMKILCLASKPLQYPLLRKQSDFRGRDGIIFTRLPQDAMTDRTKDYFESIQPLKVIVLSNFGRPFSELVIARGVKFNGKYPFAYE